MEIILASKSPRRRELLSEIYSDFKIVTADCDESLAPTVHPREGVALIAKRKGDAVLSLVPKDALVISSDTLVELDGAALGKPKDEAEAHRMLASLSGRAHNVHTGIAVHYDGRCVAKTASTAVYFKTLTDAEIEEYVKSGDPMDKAGAYGIQSGAGKFVEKIDGDYDTVVGLSVRLLRELIDEVRCD